MKIDGDELKKIKEWVSEYISEGDDLNELVEEIYNDETNYNNADITSGQRCWDYDEIHEAVFSIYYGEEE